MLNQLVAVGRLVEKPTLTKLEDGKEICRLTLAVPRSYKNAEGVYETDFLDIVLWNAIASNTVEYCNKGDLVGIKGRIQTRQYETEDGSKHKITEIVAEKVTFLSSNTKDIKENDNVKVSEE